MKRKLKVVPLSVIIPMRNSSTTVLIALESLKKQTYPIAEVIILDNQSQDDSFKKVKEFSKKSPFKIILIKRKEDRGVGASYNNGANVAKSPLIIFMHSDSELPTKNELNKLVYPLLSKNPAIASYSTIILPERIWNTYNFWEKCLFSRAVGKKSPGLNGKFDCFNKKMFLKIGGFNVTYWNKDAGGEDADLHMKLKSIGRVVLSEAKVVHLHYLGKNFSLIDWIKTKKQLARTYGRLIRIKGTELPMQAIVFASKPFLAILLFIPHMQVVGLLLLFIYSILYTRKMFMTKSTIYNPRIFLLPFINIFLVYYETFWMIKTFVFIEKR